MIHFLYTFLLFFLIFPIIHGNIVITDIENNHKKVMLRNSRGYTVKTYMPGTGQAHTKLLSHGNKRKLMLVTNTDTYALTVQKIVVNAEHDSFIALLLRSTTTDYVQSLLLSDTSDKSQKTPLKLTIDSQGAANISLLPNSTCEELGSYSGSYDALIQNPIIQIYLGALERNHLDTKEAHKGETYTLNITYKKQPATLYIRRKKFSALPIPLLQVSLEENNSVQSDSIVLLETKDPYFPIGIVRKNKQLKLDHSLSPA